MTVEVFAAPYVPPAPPAPAFPGTGLTWVGWDGSVWDLTGRTGGVVLAPGVRGMDVPPPMTRHSSVSPALAGSRHRGHSVSDREVYWPLRIFSDVSAAAWRAYDEAFWRTMDPERPGRWVVTQPDGSARELVCRFVGADDLGSDIDPGLVGWAPYQVTLVAEDPFWTSAPVVVWWQGLPPADFIPPTGAPPFAIAAPLNLGSAELTNPGEVDAWPTWWFTGPVDDVSAAVAGRPVVVPFEVAAGRMLVVDASPAARTAKEIDTPPASVTGQGPEALEAWVAQALVTATDRTIELGAGTRWGALPAGVTSPVTLTMTGTGRVRARFLPRHRRAR